MRNRVGCKIYSNIEERGRIDEILLAQSHKNPIEIGFYNKDGQYGLDEEFMQILDTKFREFEKKIVHLSIKFVLFRYGKTDKEWLDGIRNEIDLAKKIDAKYIIIHDSKWPASKRERGLFLQNMAESAKLLKSEFDIPFYLENTFEGIEFYDSFFELSNDDINFCFDIGHIRVWSNDSYEKWYEFLKKLQKSGIKIHFHIHTNNYVYDEHLSFLQKNDKETKDFVKMLINEFNSSYFILEIQRDFKECVEFFDAF